MCTVAQGVVAQTAFAQGVVAVARIAVADFLLLLIMCLQVPNSQYCSWFANHLVCRRLLTGSEPVEDK